PLNLFGQHANGVLHHLQKATFDVETSSRPTRTDHQRAIAKHGHQRGVIGKDTDLPVERRRRNRIGFTVEYGGFR
ncbi:MAG: hypothetical protein ABIV27_12045, partial [Gemmatimonadales bacterium]